MNLIIPRNVNNTLIRTKKSLECFFFDIGFFLEYFINSFDENIKRHLNYSPESLDILEAVVLERYPSVKKIIDRYEMLWVEDAGYYVGEVLRKELGGKWDVELKQTRSPYFQLPAIKVEKLPHYVQCPKWLVIESCKHRTGHFLRMHLTNAKEKAEEFSS